jgi:hypothetical protein
MPSTISAHYLRPLHAQRAICMSLHGTGDAVEVGGPAAPGVELLLSRVEGRRAGGACVDACAGGMLVVLAGAGRLGALFAEDAELFC